MTTTTHTLNVAATTTLGDSRDWTLRVRGNADLLTGDHTRVCVTGTRRQAQHTDAVAQQIIHELTESDVIINGGARGVDASALREAMHHYHKCIVVLGSGLDHPYPDEHERLFKSVLDLGGAIVSPFDDDRKPRPIQFPQRNQLIADLSTAIIVPATGRRSGTVMLATAAYSDGCPVYAVPGTFNDPSFSGCVSLIERGIATPIYSGTGLRELRNPGLTRGDSRLRFTTTTQEATNAN